MIHTILKICPCKVQAGIYIVATPIGNLRDITLRALDVLTHADIIACEDTRVSAKLLSNFSIKAKVVAYHDHNADKIRPKLFETVEQGKVVVLISDAGTPLVSDPGFKLVRDAVEAGWPVTPIPGACAPITALMGAGLPSDIFTFMGFLPTKEQAKKNILSNLTEGMGTVILFESPNRIEDTINIIAKVQPDSDVVVGRELTKKFEQFVRGNAIDVANEIGDMTKKGEIVLLIRVKDKEISTDGVEKMLKNALETMRLKDASTLVAESTGLKKKDVYKIALKIKEDIDG